ncbi:MAG: RNA methyltransferase [Lentimicrobiaceae bacterium]|nr:RNA methyltransferase [Lentimicrobiaceae bacterium]
MDSLKDFKMGMDLTAKTFAGLEDELASELKSLGAINVDIIKRGCTFRGDTSLMYKINYLSRLAIRVLKPISVFEVKSDEQLYKKVKKIDWGSIFNLNQTFSVEANLFYSDLDHSHYAALKTKDAIVDQFREATGKRPWVNIENPNIYIDVHISHNLCTISLDSSGESLHKRGYKIDADKAPINEILAAGMIKLSGWKADCDLYDPMCGSGTIPIEAAMMAMNIPAGYYRENFAFMNWEGYDEDLWMSVKSSANDKLKDLECNIYASDRSDKAIGITKRNLKHTGLHKDIIVKSAYFDSVKPEVDKGVIIMNPPYGIRLEERGELRDLYKGIGDALKSNFKGFDAWIISPNFDSVKFVGLRPSKRITLFNGPVETKYMKFEIYEGTRRYGDTEKQNWKDTRKESAKFGKDRLKKNFSVGNPKTEKKIFTKPKERSSEESDNNENRRNALDKRSKDFERRMESLRRFTGSGSGEKSGKRPRKRIDPDKN